MSCILIIFRWNLIAMTKDNFQPLYLKALRSGKLKSISDIGLTRLKECTLCPRKCGINRVLGEKGICKTGYRAIVSSYSPHFGEEAPLVGYYGSGTIFFTNCSLLCRFCQNYDISHKSNGKELTASNLASIMIRLQEMGCHNINLVTPSHVIPQIIQALYLAAQNGLRIPLVYNSSGYDELESLKLLDGLIDIYMPDFKFWDPEISGDLCGARDYPEKARTSVREMHRQVGNLEIVDGIARRGLLVRHLVMPGDMSGTAEIMSFLAREISIDTYVNIMDQYRPCGDIANISKLVRSITNSEFEQAVSSAKKVGLWRF